METGSFTITPDSSTTTFTTPIPSGMTISLAQIGTPHSMSNIPYIQSSSISGTTLSVVVWDIEGGMASPLDTAIGNLTINYFVA